MTTKGVPMPEWVEDRIETERRRLNQVSAVLKCLTVAFNEDAEADFGDVAIIAYTIIDSVIDALDAVTFVRAQASDAEDESD